VTRDAEGIEFFDFLRYSGVTLAQGGTGLSMVTWVLEGAQDLDEGAQGGGWATIDERVSCAWPMVTRLGLKTTGCDMSIDYRLGVLGRPGNR
jgi:hypothetical protein